METLTFSIKLTHIPINPSQSKSKGMLTPKMFAGLPAYRRKLFRSYCAVACTTVSPSNGSQFGLLGPPELYRSSPSPACDDTKDGDPFMDSMLLRYNTNTPYNMGLTENGSPTYMSSGNPCLDYFFHVVPDTPADEVTRRLRDAWDHDPLTALKLVCNLRGIRGTGKSDREGFYTSALWLHQNHPKTLAANVEPVAEFGYFKDLLEILYRLIEGPTARKSHILWQKGIRTPSEPKSGEEKRLEAAQKGMIKYNTDPAYRFLHEKISDIFAEHLELDMKKLKAGKYNDFSLSAKWCPSLYSTFDNYTSLCESIARRLFPRDKYPEYEGIEEAHYAYRVRDRLRKEVLVPLRRALQLPEVFIGAQEWSSVMYSRVASIAMRNYKDLFAKHDAERFQLYLDSVKKGGAKIAAGALLPHNIVQAVKYEQDEVAELQWTRIVDDLSKIGKLTNCLAISDVSGSMCGEPLEVSVALGLLVSELSEEPWKGKLITFSSQPQLQVIEGKNLRSKIRSVEKMDWEVNTNFQRVFDKILKVAVEGKLKEDEMIKRLFVFSDMEFDEASTSTALKWETDYQAIVRKFNEKGFSRVPEIVFWNLRNSKATPVPSHQPGVALVSGFSKNLLKVFLEQGGVLDPLHTMNAAISGEEYQKLVVLD